MRFRFHSHNTIYFCCDGCGHINGDFQDTEEFCRQMYEPVGEDCYTGAYNDNNKDVFNNRVKTIYSPKVDFMLESLEKYIADNGIRYSSKDLKYLDIGAGCGHFVKACKDRNLDVTGIEVDIREVDYGNSILGGGADSLPIREYCSVS